MFEDGDEIFLRGIRILFRENGRWQATPELTYNHRHCRMSDETIAIYVNPNNPDCSYFNRPVSFAKGGRSCKNS